MQAKSWFHHGAPRAKRNNRAAARVVIARRAAAPRVSRGLRPPAFARRFAAHAWRRARRTPRRARRHRRRRRARGAASPRVCKHRRPPQNVAHRTRGHDARRRARARPRTTAHEGAAPPPNSPCGAVWRKPAAAGRPPLRAGARGAGAARNETLLHFTVPSPTVVARAPARTARRLFASAKIAKAVRASRAGPGP